MPGSPADGTKKRTRSRYAVLGMLSSGLETGYAMKRHIETNLGHFWSESYGQICRILRQLVKDWTGARPVPWGPGATAAGASATS